MKTTTPHIVHSIPALLGRFRQIGAVACALALLAVTSTSALAQSSGKTRPYHAEYEQFATPTWYGATAVTRGNATHLGKFTSTSENYYLGFNADGLFHGEGSEITVAANGDETWTTWVWTLNVFVPMSDWVVNTTWTIVGGTGRFANATGHGTAVGRFNSDGNLVSIIDGVIHY